jgi:hypothetical protein
MSTMQAILLGIMLAYTPCIAVLAVLLLHIPDIEDCEHSEPYVQGRY